jgi:hypothetical protein
MVHTTPPRRNDTGGTMTATLRCALRERPLRTLFLAGLAAIALLVLSASTLVGAGPQERVLELLDEAVDGDEVVVGLYLRQIDGATIAAVNEHFQFEPASSIKALIHFHAVRQVQDGAVIDGAVVTFDRLIPWFTDQNGSCPPLTGPDQDVLSVGLWEMMVNSDNRWTQAMRDFFDDDAIDATRASLGMHDTKLSHLIGCLVSEPPDGHTRGIDDPNQFTLADAGLLYEAVAAGYLDEQHRAEAFALMSSDLGDFNALVDEEAAGLGLRAEAIASFKAQRSSALKGGSYGGGGFSYRSVAGWAEIPWRDTATCDVASREYVYGAFIHRADSIDDGFMGIRPLGVELFREEIRAALESWAACEADLRITSSVVVDPPESLDVKTESDLTVRVAMQHLGPADPVDAVLTVTPTVPDDCTVTPGERTEDVLAMESGVLAVRELTFSVACDDPSFHQFQFASEIGFPEGSPLEDPDLTNNTGFAQATIPVIAYADLAILDWDFSELDAAGIAHLLVGQDFWFDTTKTVTTLGDTEMELYEDPVDAVITKSIHVPEGVEALFRIGAGDVPATVTVERDGEIVSEIIYVVPGGVIRTAGEAIVTVAFGADALLVSQDREIAEEFGITCLGPGSFDLTFHNSITPLDEHVLDPDETNNIATVVRTVECATPVQINIRPGNARNQIVMNSSAFVPVAILTTDEGEYDLPLAFDATTVDHTTVRFGTVAVLNEGGGSAVAPDRDFIRDSFEMDDQTKDGDLDMVLLVTVPGSGIDADAEEACLTGQYVGEDNQTYTFFGCDFISVR